VTLQGVTAFLLCAGLSERHRPQIDSEAETNFPAFRDSRSPRKRLRFPLRAIEAPKGLRISGLSASQPALSVYG
jgi:hypothetical protein